jgi:hypothetical protein
VLRRKEAKEKIMPKDWVRIEKTKGAKRIEEYCGVAANSLGLKLNQHILVN